MRATILIAELAVAYVAFFSVLWKVVGRLEGQPVK
jgi:hypothetical protein